ncbi:MAG: hypothetical protein IKO36_08510 [Bacteroidaceae bacterium]|nr:hypothetical protein [Bacteroidaceae bacterium]
MNNTIEKPTVVVIEETKTKIIDVIKESGLPAFIIEPILNDFLNETRAAAQNEYINQKNQYEKMLKESEEVNNEGD